ncbi:MAG: hypothetical protein HLUCCO16_14320 [Phormidium sp. OSCR]|nr:MAG: hypothetical protein HLUCCO16_14320 [Phormidium sp. OSCR]
MRSCNPPPFGEYVFSYLFPARGRKLDYVAYRKHLLLPRLFLSFPRKGTETEVEDGIHKYCFFFVFSYLFPARGRKHP